MNKIHTINTKDQASQQIRRLAGLLDIMMQLEKPDLAKMEALHSELTLLLGQDIFSTDLGDDIKWAQQILEIYHKWLTGVRSGPIQTTTDENISQDLTRVITQRRSIRSWQPKEVSRDLVDEILMAGLYAPSAYNLQAWKFILSFNKSENMIAGDSSNKSMLAKAPVKIYVAVDRQYYEETYAPAMDAAFCSQNMLLKAHASGLGACVLYQGELLDQDNFRKKYDLADSLYVYCVIVLGYAAHKPVTPGRKNIRECTIL